MWSTDKRGRLIWQGKNRVVVYRFKPARATLTVWRVTGLAESFMSKSQAKEAARRLTR